MLARIIKEQRDLALLVLRVGLGLIFLVKGWLHVAGLEGYTNAFANSFGIPLPQVLAPLTAYVELIAGAAILLGVLTRYAGGALAIIMAVATLQVKLPGAFSINPETGEVRAQDFLGLNGFWDLELSLFILALALFLVGPGAYSVERTLFRREL